jgi:hypothetical protein
MDFGRQRAMDLNKMGCGGCKSRLVQTKPVPKEMGGKENKANPFGMFVKDHFAAVKRENPGSPHKDIMGILSKKYRQAKEDQILDKEQKDSRETIVIESDEEDIVTSMSVMELH